jgi:cell division protease FtsH
MKKVPLAPDVDARVIARGTPGFSGADLANLVNEAALLAARAASAWSPCRVRRQGQGDDGRRAPLDGHDRGREADDRLSRGRPCHRRAHEPASDPIHKATIIPRGRALGMVMRLPGATVQLSPRQDARDLAVAMGGRVAEIIFGYDKVSSGASGDISRPRSGARHGHQMGHVGQARPGGMAWRRASWAIRPASRCA